jgi:hypothetical protein
MISLPAGCYGVGGGRRRFRGRGERELLVRSRYRCIHGTDNGIGVFPNDGSSVRREKPKVNAGGQPGSADSEGSCPLSASRRSHHSPRRIKDCRWSTRANRADRQTRRHGRSGTGCGPCNVNVRQDVGHAAASHKRKRPARPAVACGSRNSRSPVRPFRRNPCSPR